jgi:hypothetical protein
MKHNSQKSIQRERKTIEVMIRIYCQGQHASSGGICEICRGLLDYARERLSRCPFKDDKPVCADCTVHCYRPEMREQVSAVMRYAGPRMIWRHPFLALAHFMKQRSSHS